MEQYDLETEEWREYFPSLRHCRVAHGVTVHKNKVIRLITDHTVGVIIPRMLLSAIIIVVLRLVNIVAYCHDNSSSAIMIVRPFSFSPHPTLKRLLATMIMENSFIIMAIIHYID